MTKAIRKREPWIKFYLGDWRAEPRLKMCTRAARSLWLDMLGIMHEADPYGFLLVEGIAPTSAQLSNLVGDPERQVKQWLDELRRAGVPSIVGEDMPDDVERLLPAGVPDGTILSRRMVRDAAKRAQDRRNGGRGGNPILGAQGDIPGVNPPTIKSGFGDNPKSGRGLRPRSQKPESRKPPDPPSAAVNPAPPDPSWAAWQARAEAIFGAKHCNAWLFVCRVVEADGKVGLEAPSLFMASRIRADLPRLDRLFGQEVSILVRAAGDSA